MSKPNCIKCSVVLTEENRFVTKAKRSNQCLDCRRKYAREYVKKSRNESEKKVKCVKETCFKCDKSFEEVERWKDNQCIECYREYQRNYQAKRRLNPKHVDVAKERDQQCFKCHVEFTPENRYKTTNQCLDCYRALTHDWYEKNKSTIRTKFNERYQLDEKFKEYRNYRSAFKKILHRSQKSSKYINFDPEEMFDWLKFLAREMAFDFEEITSGDLVVDHVIPLDKGLQGEIDWEYVIGWWNMSPLKPEDNLSKNNRLPKSQLLDHHALLMKYTRRNDICNLEIETYLKHLQDTSQCSGNP